MLKIKDHYHPYPLTSYQKKILTALQCFPPPLFVFFKGQMCLHFGLSQKQPCPSNHQLD